LDHLTNPGLAYSQIFLARIYEPLVLVNTVISWIRLADLNPCTTCTMYISLTIFLFRSGIAFYFHFYSTVQVTVRPKKNMCVYGHMSTKSRVGRHSIFFLPLAKPEIVVSGIRFDSGISFSKFPVSRLLLKLFYDENTQFSYLLCSQFRQKASGWINKTLLLIKQHVTYMNISRYANIDKFVNIRYIFLLARWAYSWLFQLAQIWKLLAPSVGLGDLLTPVIAIYVCWRVQKTFLKILVSPTIVNI
jgi:hypothetical protein